MSEAPLGKAAPREQVPTQSRLALLKSPRTAVQLAWLLLGSRWKARRCTAVGKWLRVYGPLIISNQGAIILGERVRLRGTHVPIELAALPGGTLKIGAGCFINSGVSICAQQSITIGSNCGIGNYTLIMDTDFHAIESYATGQHGMGPKVAPVRIEDDVWLGARTTILKGVTIGRGAVVAAGAVVTKSVPPYTVVAGVPARPIRRLQEWHRDRPDDVQGPREPAAT